MPFVDACLPEIDVETSGRRLRELERRAARSVLLPPVVHLDDLHLVGRSQGAGRLGDEAEEDVHADAHVGGDEKGDLLGAFREHGFLLGGEAGGSDHQRDLGPRAGLRVLHCRGRGGEIDGDVHAARERLVDRTGNGHAGLADSRDDAGIASDERTVRSFRGRRDFQIRLGAHGGGDAASHPPADPEHGDPDHASP